MIKQLSTGLLLTLLILLCCLEAKPEANIWLIVGQGMAIITTLITLIAIQNK